MVWNSRALALMDRHEDNLTEPFKLIQSIGPSFRVL